MAEITLVIGSEARTTDNKVSADVKCVVVDPGTRTVTHLVVGPKEGRARLVPLDQVDAPAGTIRLRYTEAEFKNLAAAEEIFAQIFRSGLVEVFTDLVPKLLPAEKEEHRGDHVHATDGEIGRLRALCIDPRTHQVTHVHVLLKGGHLRRHKEVAISSDNVSGFTAGIHLNISEQQVQDLAHGDIDHPSE